MDRIIITILTWFLSYLIMAIGFSQKVKNKLNINISFKKALHIAIDQTHVFFGQFILSSLALTLGALLIGSALLIYSHLYKSNIAGNISEYLSPILYTLFVLSGLIASFNTIRKTDIVKFKNGLTTG